MHITIRAFASYREAIGSPRVQLEFPEGITPAQVWQRLVGSYPMLQRLPQPSAFAVNEEYVAGDTALGTGDELVLIPPVSGGSVALVEQPIDVNGLLDQVRHPQAGAIVLFLGTVRDTNQGRHVDHLEYEAYQEMARREMEGVVETAGRRWPLLGIGIVHRLGQLDVGEISVAVAVSSEHRKEAFEAGRFAIDTLKRTVPIWKKEVWEEGAVWIGSEERNR
jgi:molybdopterin synthase catalytic subunit/molybdopterin converting factor small subunit